MIKFFSLLLFSICATQAHWDENDLSYLTQAHQMQATGTHGPAQSFAPRMMAKDDSSLPRTFGGLGHASSGPGTSAPTRAPAPSAPKSAVNPQGAAPKKEVNFGEQGASALGGNPLEQKLDFSRYSERTKGDAAHHLKVQHSQLRLDKPDQSVFYGEPTHVTQEAWDIARQKNIQPINCGYEDVYIVPRPNAGYVGGPGGQRGNLDHITIKVEAGTNKLITAHPSGKTLDFPDWHVPFSGLD